MQRSIPPIRILLTDHAASLRAIIPLPTWGITIAGCIFDPDIYSFALPIAPIVTVAGPALALWGSGPSAPSLPTASRYQASSAQRSEESAPYSGYWLPFRAMILPASQSWALFFTFISRNFHVLGTMA
jgi:hypothetical protein